MSVITDSFYCSQRTSPVNVTLTVRDASGNSHSSIAVVTVRDTIKPIINNMPSNVTLTGNGFQCAATYVWTLPTASDNCGVNSFTSSHTPDSCYLFPQGVTTVTYTAVDPSGNTTVRSFTVTVNNCQGAAVSLNTNSSNCVDSSLTVDVKLNNYVGSLGALSLTINYPPSQMSFASIDSVLPGIIPGSVVSNAVNGRLRIAWSSTDSIKICGGASTLLRLRFNTLGVFGASSLGFDLSIPENNELATGLAVVFPSTYSGVSTTLNPCLGIIGQVTYPKSPAVPLNNVNVIVRSDATYRFDSVAFNTVATSGATNLTVSDDQTITGIPLGFSFNYFGNTYDSINICSNGWVSFTETSTTYSVNFGGSVNNAIHG
ncbi:MAG: HYR domain-containing protein, partial [Bacteroidota bacterium]